MRSGHHEEKKTENSLAISTQGAHDGLQRAAPALT
jgi:hypothetical protein